MVVVAAAAAVAVDPGSQRVLAHTHSDGPFNMKTRFALSVSAALLIGSAGLCGCSSSKQPDKDAAPVQQLSFATPEDAVTALLYLADTNDKAYAKQLFGPEASELSSDDPDRDAYERRLFAAALEKRHELRTNPDGSRSILIGENNAEFPVPIIQTNGRWMFDTVAGVDKLEDMRIGYNELKTIAALRALPAAQAEYFKSDHDGNGIHEYARRLRSTEGKHDGLYWPATGPEDASPLGPYAADADGYYSADTGYNGYFFTLITGQSASAPGGAKQYESNGLLVNGWGALAYPSHYGVTGIKSFIVNQDGVVYEKDLGAATPDAARTVTVFDPADGWTPVGN